MNDLEAGTIVTPQGDPNETIVGIVVNPSPTRGWMTIDQEQWVDVIWFSTRRGVFSATELYGDLDVAFLGDRADITDPKLDHEIVASLLWVALAARTKEQA